jgi:hypothetical protein
MGLGWSEFNMKMFEIVPKILQYEIYLENLNGISVEGKF